MISESLVELKQVKLAQYEASTIKTILDDVSFNLAPNSFTALLGNSSSGNSAIIEALLGFTKINFGEIKVTDKILSNLTESELDEYRRNLIHFIGPQENLISQLSLKENILLPYSLNRSEPDETKFDEIINICQLEQDLYSVPDTLPQVTQQKAAITRAILAPARIIVCDNPCANLRSEYRLEVLSLLRTAVNEFGKTVLLATPEPVEATLTQRVLMMRDGKVVGEVNNPTLFALLSSIQLTEEMH